MNLLCRKLLINTAFQRGGERYALEIKTVLILTVFPIAASRSVVHSESFYKAQ